MINFDHDKMTEKVAFVLRNMENLKFLRDIPEQEFLKDFRNIEASKHLLQVSIEAFIDMANHIIAMNNLGRPKTYNESFMMLRDKRVISEINYEALSKMTKFRNRVVHIYHDLDPGEIYGILNNNLRDFTLFLEEIRRHLQAGTE